MLDSKTIRQLIGTANDYKVLTIFLIGALFLLVSPKPLLSRWADGRERDSEGDRAKGRKT